MSAQPLAIRDVRLVDPETEHEYPGALLVREGRIADLGPRLFNDGLPGDARVIAGEGHVLAPGLIDVGVVTGEPGAEHRETLASASLAAAAGGVTTLVIHPNTQPVIDDMALVDFILRRARDTARVRVLPMAALTKGREGQTMTEMGLLAEAGAVAFTDADRHVANAQVMRRALQYARTFDLLVQAFPAEPALSQGQMNAGELATRLGLAGIPTAAEAIAADRDIRLAELTDARLHLAPVTCAAALACVRAAKAKGLPVTAATTAAHLSLNVNDVHTYLTYRKLMPPLRVEEDRQALVAALADGTLDLVVSGHDPQAPETKRLPFAQAAFGGTGLETLLAALVTLHHGAGLKLSAALAPATVAPARLLGLPQGRLAVGAPADLVLFDPDATWTVVAERLVSRAKNSPFDGRRLQGRVIRTIVAGSTVFGEAGDEHSGI